MERRNILTLAMVMALAGCAVTAHRGSVAMKINDRQAHICMGKGEVKAGDRVVLFRNECSSPSSPQLKNNLSAANPKACRRIMLGEGRVVEPLNDHYSVIQVDPGVVFEEGAIVEKP